MEILRGELANTDDDLERSGLLAALEEEAEYQHLRVREDRVQLLEQLLDESERDRAARLDNMHELDRLLRESERVRAAYELVVERQAAQLLYARQVRVLRSILRRTKRVAAYPYRLGRRMYRALSGNAAPERLGDPGGPR